jgi:hypothetical protein
MALSDQLMALATRAKDLEDRAAAAKQKTKTDLEQDVKAARESAQAQSDALRQRAETKKGEISAWSDNMQQSWNDHLADVRKHVDDRRAKHNMKSAQRAADHADDNAEFAIAFASAAIEEAEYAVLDAELAHMELDELTNV